jgi:hypothetical protein
VQPEELCSEEVSANLVVEGSKFEIEMTRPEPRAGGRKRLASFACELGRLLQVGYGRPYRLRGPGGHLEVAQAGRVVQIIYTAHSGFRAMCQVLRENFYAKILRGLRKNADDGQDPGKA